MKRIRLSIVALASTALALPAFGQGPLTPPGPPAPTMKTLDELDARIGQTNTAVTQANAKLDQLAAKTDPRKSVTLSASSIFNITQPGSYYLTASLTTAGTALVIDSDDVTLDLMGFTIAGNGSVNTGIQIATPGTPRSRITVRNGTIRNFNVGISVVAGVTSAHFEDLLVQGCTNVGIRFNTAAAASAANVVRRCRFHGNAQGLAIFGAPNSPAARNIVDECEAIANTNEGFAIFGPGNLIIRNRASGNGTDFMIGSGNAAGAVVVAGASGTGTTDPYANLRF